MTTALGIRVAPGLLDQWREWFAPSLQPFGTSRLGSDAQGLGRPFQPSLNLRDTFHVYSDENWTWLEEPEFADLDPRWKRALIHGRAATGRLGDLTPGAARLAKVHRIDSRVVWWPTLMRRVGDAPLVAYVENGLPPSRHQEVTVAMWNGTGWCLPGVADLVGRFATASGANCFGHVLAAAGVGNASGRSQREPFERWLAACADPIRGPRRDHLPGVVLVWRNHDGRAEHAAVTIGGGYASSKPSQGWFSPHLVWTVRETIAASRYRGVTLHRYLITG